MKRFIATTAALGGIALAVSGCGGATTPPIRSATSASATVAPATSAFPEQDTPIDSAPADLRQVWAPYQVTIIPSRHIFDAMPALPTVTNATNGAVSDVDARLMGAGEYRVNTIEGWAFRKSQGTLLNRLLSDPFRHGPDFQALAQGAGVNFPPCQLYPTAITVRPVDASSQAFFTGRGEPTKSTVELAITFGACVATNATYPDGHTAEVYPASRTTTIVVAGAPSHDAVLGDIWVATAAGGCDQAGAPAEACPQ